MTFFFCLEQFMKLNAVNIAVGSLTLLAIVLMAVLIVRMTIQWYQHRQYLKRVKEIEAQPKEPFERLHTGWVVVKRDALTVDLPWQDTVGMTLPAPVTMMLQDLDGKAMFDIMVTMNHIEPDTPFRDDMRRGLTIGSALFKYSIPESFVLFDRRTDLLTELFRIYDQERKLPAQWLEDEAIFETNKALFSSIESRDLGIDRDMAIQFYYTYYGMVASWVIPSVEGKYYPHLSALVDTLMRKAGLNTNDDALIHQMYITVVVIAELLELKVPLYWVMRSPLVEAVLQAAKGMEPQKPQLSLVPKN